MESCDAAVAARTEAAVNTAVAAVRREAGEEVVCSRRNRREPTRMASMKEEKSAPSGVWPVEERVGVQRNTNRNIPASVPACKVSKVLCEAAEGRATT